MPALLEQLRARLDHTCGAGSTLDAALMPGGELLVLDRAGAVDIHLLEDRVDLGRRRVEAERYHGLAELLGVDGVRLIVIPLVEEVDDARLGEGEREGEGESESDSLAVEVRARAEER